MGHWGTLDPAACGVLVLGIGKATRLFPLIADTRKQYIFELVVGEKTDSGDGAGHVIARAPVPDHWKQRLSAAAAALVGPQTQVPPMHSAVKVAGKPLYRSARVGLTVVRAPRPTHVYSLRLLEDSLGPRSARLFVECDAGTYVRVLCEDLGRQLGLPARMGALLRTGSGPFALRDSAQPARIQAAFDACLVDPLRVLDNPRVELDAVRAPRFSAGNEIRLSSAPASAESNREVARTETLVTYNGVLIGVGHVFARDAQTMLAPTRVFAEL